MEPFKVILLDDLRHHICNIKTINLLANVMAFEKARQAGCQEAVLHRNGRVTECCRCNVGIIKNGRVRTAPTDNLILPGISRAHILKQCKNLGIAVDETPFNIEELLQADEIIISSTSHLCVPVSHVDGAAVGGNAPDILHALREAVFAEFRTAIYG
jgi:D-alanine transaminase